MPPDRISIKDDTGVERSTVVGPYAEGDIITLSCEVFGGKCHTLFIKRTTVKISLIIILMLLAGKMKMKEK